MGFQPVTDEDVSRAIQRALSDMNGAGTRHRISREDGRIQIDLEPLPEPMCADPKPAQGLKFSTPLVQFPMPGMVLDSATGIIRWEKPGDHMLYRPVWEWGIDQRLMTAFRMSLSHLDRKMWQQLAPIFDLQNLKYLSGVLALWAASHFIGVGWGVDTILIMAAGLISGAQIIMASQDLWDFIEIAVRARTHQELYRASRHMANFISMVGVDVMLGFFLKKAAGTSFGSNVGNEFSRMRWAIEEAGMPGLNRTLGEISVPPFFTEPHSDMRGFGQHMPEDLVIVPPHRLTSPNALRKASRCSGMTCGAVVQAQTVASSMGVIVEFRNAKGARRLRVLGHPGKPEWMKNNTITPDDIPLGAPANALDQAGYFKPLNPDPALQYTDPAQHQRLMKRWKMRMDQWNDPKLRAVINEHVQTGEIIVHDKVIIHVESRRAHTGDNDLYGVKDPVTLKLIPEADPRHQKVLEKLGNSHVSLEHPSLAAWATNNAEDFALRQRLMQSHLFDEPLTQYRPDGSIWYSWADPSDF